jgi:MFS transporter, MCT family, solute carrier family 16 (monocarboxylic acid transporters), member 14
MIYLPAMVSVTSYFDKYRSRATGIAAVGPSLGSFTMAPVLTFLLTTYRWQNTLVIYGFLVLCCSVFGFFFSTKKNEGSESSLKMVKRKSDSIELEENLTNVVEIFSLLKDSSFLIFAIANFLVR